MLLEELTRSAIPSHAHDLLAATFTVRRELSELRDGQVIQMFACKG